MNYDLAIRALEGLSNAPMTADAGEHGIEITGTGPAFKELARLCLLLGNEATAVGEAIELSVPMHLTEGSLPLKLRLTG
ncbi:MAG TPA: hypothetical protein VGF40_20095 [Thermoanaerobaculia bacterium]